MHKFLRTVGFSDFRKKDLEIVLNDIIAKPEAIRVTKDSEGNEFAELTNTYGSNFGITVCGTFNEFDEFEMDYYYPFVRGTGITTEEQIVIEKHAEKETYAGVCDELNLGVTLIFYIQNVADYLSEKQLEKKKAFYGAKLSGLSTDARVLLPVEKAEKKEKKDNCKKQERSKLLAEARDGNEEAIESLTLEDMDTYTMLTRRVMKEDILSIVDSYFMPYGIESDQYAILGVIEDCKKRQNELTLENIYCMKVKCNDLVFDVTINEKDLMGEPTIGRRLKAVIWMQGSVCL